MNKSQLTAQLSRKHNRKIISQSVNLFFENIKSALKNGERVEIRGFGVFYLKSYGSYLGRNPKTGESVMVAPKRLPIFKPGKDMRSRADGSNGLQKNS